MTRVRNAYSCFARISYARAELTKGFEAINGVATSLVQNYLEYISRRVSHSTRRISNACRSGFTGCSEEFVCRKWLKNTNKREKFCVFDYYRILRIL